MCEDYPCCGHTDGLGCDWVSPNEVQPCSVCIEARAFNPYHSVADGCKTQRAQAQTDVPDNTTCSYYGVEDDCDGERADIAHNNQFLCFDCYASMLEYERQMQEHYDDAWH